MYTTQNQHTVSTRELAWNKAGVAFTGVEGDLTEDRMTAEEALRRGGQLGWNVRKIELTTTGMPAGGQVGDRRGEDMGVTIPRQYATLRDTDNGPLALGIVGERYKVHQNEETVQFLETIIDEGGAHFEAAGFMGDGQKTFVVMKMPDAVMIGGEDGHDFYLGCTNTHDGSGKLEAWTTMLRLRCTNMLTPSMKGAASRFGVRHTGDVKGKVEQARRSLQISFKWAEQFQAGGDWMLAQPMNLRSFRKMVDELEPASTSEHQGWRDRQEARRDALVYLFTKADTNEFGRGTRWAAYNAFTEFGDWGQAVKGADDAGTLRAQRQLEGATDKFKQQAWDYLLAA